MKRERCEYMTTIPTFKTAPEIKPMDAIEVKAILSLTKIDIDLWIESLPKEKLEGLRDATTKYWRTMSSDTCLKAIAGYMKEMEELDKLSDRIKEAKSWGFYLMQQAYIEYVSCDESKNHKPAKFRRTIQKACRAEEGGAP